MSPSTFRLLCGLALAPALAAPALAATAYLPAPGTVSLQPTASYQRTRDIFLGPTPASLTGDLIQKTIGLDGTWGLAPRVALDWSLAYSTVTYKGGTVDGLTLTADGQNQRSGLADTQLGLAYTLLDEFTSLHDAAPTLTLRVGAILEGNYDTGFLNAVGDGASGAEVQLLFGKFFPLLNSGLYGDLGYRALGGDTPDAWLGSLGLYKTLGRITLSTGLRAYRSTSGIDILGPGFDSIADFPATKEIFYAHELGVTWRATPAHSFSLGYAHTFDGRNTPKKQVVVLAGNLSF